jgi:hypothetical protein
MEYVRSAGRRRVVGSLIAGCLFLSVSVSAEPAGNEVAGRYAAASSVATGLVLGAVHPLQATWLGLAAAGNIFGRVVDSSDKPIEGAQLRASRAGRAGSWRAESTRDGYFFIVGAELTDSLRLEVVHPRFGESLHSVAAGLGFFPAAEPQVIELLLPPYVRGKVVSEEGAAIAGSDVVLEFGNQRRESKSAADGTFSFEGLASEGYLDLTVRAIGHALWKQQLLAARGALELGDLRLQPELRRFGRVVDTEGNPVAGARLAVKPRWEFDKATLENGVVPEPWTTSDREGRFSLQGLPRGNQVVLIASAVGFVPASAELDEQATSLEIVLERGAFVSGTVYDDDDPVAAVLVEVKLWEEPLKPGPSTTTDERGHFRVGPLKPGKRLIVASEFPAYPGGDYIDVPAEGIDAIELQLKKSVDLAGIVRDPEGRPVEGARLKVVLPGIEERSAGSTAPDGSFEIAELPEAHAVLTVGHPDFGSVEREVQLRAGMPPLEISLPEGLRGELTIAVKSGSDPLDEAKVSVRDLRFAKRIFQGATDRRGAITFDGLVAGHYRLEASHPDHQPFTDEISFDPGNTREIEVQLTGANRIEGRIASLAPEDLLRLEPSAFDDSGSRLGTIELDRETGKFEVNGLTPGIWNLRFALDSFRSVTRRVEVGEERIFLDIDWPQEW